MEVKFEKLIILGCLGTLELVPLGCLGALDGWWCSELNHCGVKLRASVGGLQLGCGDRAEKFDGYR